MKPSTVFKVLVGTIALLVVTPLIIEMMNLNLNSSIMTQTVTKAVEQACDLFGQETYLREDFGSSINQDTLISESEATVMVSGTFYESSDPTTVYNSLYRNNVTYKNWLREHQGYWTTLDNVYKAMSGEGSGDKLIGDIWLENKVTPLNLGITYLDKGTVEKIARWNLAAILLNGVKGLNGNYENLKRDGHGTYAAYKGYKVYVNALQITDIKYKVYDLTNSAEASKFESLTHMNADKLVQNMGLSSGAGYSRDERCYFCLASITYKVDIAYEGITYWGRALNWIWGRNSVEGLGTSPDGIDTSGLNFNSGVDTLTGGGDTGTAGVEVPGTIIYYVTR